MKKKVKLFIADVIILLIAATAVFFIGWITFYVSPGQCAVMISKTSGIYEKPIVAGEFVWRWERLLPTNVNLVKFQTEPYVAVKGISGELPSAKVYGKYYEQSVDFNYDISMKIKLSITPEGIYSLVKNHDVKKQEDMDSFFDSKANYISQKAVDYLVKNPLAYVKPVVLTPNQISDIFGKNDTVLQGFAIQEIEFTRIKLPDVQLYEKAKTAFNEYEKELSSKMKSRADAQAASLVEEERTMVQLEKFAQLLQKYPELQDIAKNGDINQLVSTMRSFR